MPLQHKKVHYFILLLFCIPLFFVSVQNTHTYGDDWAQYVKEALNIAEGKSYYQSAYIFNPRNTEYAPPQYPPGYPLLMAPVVKFTGMAVSPLLYLNTVFLSLMMFLAYRYFSGFTTGLNAMCLAIILGYLDIMTEQKGFILSDLPCALFTLLYLNIREHHQTWNYKKVVLLCLVGAFAMLIRTQSVVIVLAELALFLWYFAGRKKARNRVMPLYYPLFIALGTLLLFAVLNYLVFPAPGNSLAFYAGIYKAGFKQETALGLLGTNFNYLFDLLDEVLYYPVKDRFFQTFGNIIGSSSLLLAFIGLVRMLRKELSFSILFFLLMCVLIVVTPVRQGLRYLLPALPVFLLFVLKGAGLVLPLITPAKTKIIALPGLVVFLALGYDTFKQRLHPDTSWSVRETDRFAFDYMRGHIGDSDIVLFTKPRLLTLYSGRRSMNLAWKLSPAANRAQADAMGAAYLLYGRHLSAASTDAYLQQQPRPYTDSVIINSDYTLYRLRPNP